MSTKIDLANALSRYAHKDQLYGEYDYFEEHILSVVKLVIENTKDLDDDEFIEDCIIVAYLHDVAEDTPISINTIEDLFGAKIADSVWAISKSVMVADLFGNTYRTTPAKYEEYIKRVKQDDITLLVKICDTHANLNASLCNDDHKRIAKYTKQLELLEG